MTTSPPAGPDGARHPLRVVLDGTPMLGQRTGIGTYVTHLVDALQDLASPPASQAPDRQGARWPGPGLSLTLAPFTVRTADRPALPDGVRWRHRPAPARLLRALWGRVDLPPVELLTGRCDVFHATNFVLPPTRRARGVVTVHDLAFLRHPDTVDATSLAYRELVPRGVRRAAVVLTPSRAVAAQVAAEYGLPDDRVAVTPLGVDPAWARARPLEGAARQGLGLPDRYLVFVGTREPRKELPVLLAAHARARRADPAVPPLVLCGPAGWGTDPLSDVDGGDGRPGDVLPAGFLPQDVLRSVVAGATALVLPSRDEGFGLPVLEAQACGVPVVCSDLPVLREVAGPHSTFVPVGDADALAAALTRHPAPDAAGTDRAGRRRWAARFTWRACAQATLEAYGRAVT